MPPRRSITLLSAIVHAAILTAVVVGQLFAIGPLPTPRSVLAFTETMPIQLTDIVLPAPLRSARTVEPSPSDAAPLVPPDRISPETVRNVEEAPRGSADGSGVDAGLAVGIDLPGNGMVVEPAPTPAAPAPRGPIRLHSGMQAPQKIVNVPPRYPALAQTARVEGVVVLEATIDTTGRVNDVRVVRSIPLLDQAAMDAVRQWRFTPTLLNGEPVSILMTVTVRFTLQ